MLKLILGRARAGKTAKLFQTLAAQGQTRPQVLLVPEQISHDAERQLCALCGSSASRYAEVLSFTRLAHRVFHQAGGLATPQLDEGGRLLLISQAVSAVSGSLRVYARPSQKAAFLKQLLDTADELKSYCVLPEELIAAAEDQPAQQGDRLRDLGLILSAYQALTAQRAADPRDKLTRLSQTLGQCEWFKGKDVYLDGFTDFTPQQRLVIQPMLRQAHSVTVALTCDSLEGDDPVFLPSRRTALELIALCREHHIDARYEILKREEAEEDPWLCHMEAHLFSDGESCALPGQSICLYRAQDPYAEAEWAAGEILRLVREQGWHFRDIALSVRTMEDYAPVLETVFRRYEIPLFLGRVEPILEKPVLTLLTAALDCVNRNYEYEDVFRYLKTGLAGVDWEDIDLLENYVLCWDIRGGRWTRDADWSWHPIGYALPWRDEDTELLGRMNALRRDIVRPLQTLAEHRQGTGLELCQALFQFMEEIQLPQRLTQRSNALREQGDLQQADEYRQLWEILLRALEQCSDLLEKQTMELEYFSDLFRLVLSQYSVGTIPVSLDRVNAGEISRLNRCRCKALFLLGVNDEQFPKVSQAGGLLTDEDRSLLTERGLELAPSAQRRLDREQTMAYDILTRPTQLLVLTCPRQSGSDEKRPAILWRRLERMFPQIPRGRQREENRLLAPLPALELGAERGDDELIRRLAQHPGWEEMPRRIAQARTGDRGSLSPEGVRTLYTDRVSLSASKMEQLKSCHFSYFCQFGLKAKPRKRAGFDAPETGTFIHFVLEHVLQAASAEGGVAGLTRQRRKELTDTSVQEYIREELGGMEDESPRFRYLFRRLLGSVDLIVENVVEELKNSRFQPLRFELGFGKGQELPPVQIQVEGITLSISGFVDRVDGWERDGRVYLRVVDYKTGRKSFNLTDVWHGLSLQMLLYLFTLQERGEEIFGVPTQPAGVLYLPARDVLLSGSREMDEDERRRAADKALRRSGLLLSDEDVLRAMEQWGENGPRFLPLKVSNKGSISGESLATAEQWGRLQRRLNRLLGEMGREVAQGVIDADPYLKGDGHSPCDYCDYVQACHFEPGRGSDRRRWLYGVKGKEFWEAKEAEE